MLTGKIPWGVIGFIGAILIVVGCGPPNMADIENWEQERDCISLARAVLTLPETEPVCRAASVALVNIGAGPLLPVLDGMEEDDAALLVRKLSTFRGREALRFLVDLASDERGDNRFGRRGRVSALAVAALRDVAFNGDTNRFVSSARQLLSQTQNEWLQMLDRSTWMRWSPELEKWAILHCLIPGGVAHDETIEALSKGGLPAALAATTNSYTYGPMEVPLLIRLLADRTRLAWTSRGPVIWELDRRYDTPTTPAKEAADRLVELHSLYLDVTVPLVAAMASGEWEIRQGAAEVLNRLGEAATPAIRAALNSQDEVSAREIRKFVVIRDDAILYVGAEPSLLESDFAEDLELGEKAEGRK